MSESTDQTLEQERDNVYRAMREGEESGPEIGLSARCLGVRTGIGYGTDVPVDSDGFVYPRTGGLSVAPNDPVYLPDVRRPPEFGGRGKDPVWRFDIHLLPDGLVYRADPGNPDKHGFIEPAAPMPFEEFQKLLAKTRDSWDRVV